MSRPPVEVFETPDKPLTRGFSSPHTVADTTDEDVDRTATRPDAARSAFAGKDLQPPTAGDSPAIPPRPAVPASQCPFCCSQLPRRPRETLLERYERLQREAAELAAELTSAGDEQTRAAVEAEAHKLRLALATSAHAGLAADFVARAGVGKQGAAPSSMTYEVYVTQEGVSAKSALTAAVAAAERRVAALEALVGQPTPGAPLPLADAVAEWRKRLHGLTPTQLDALSLRLVEANAAIEGFHRLSSQAAGPAVSAEDVATINKVYAGMQRWEAVVKILPAVAERLRQLEPLRGSAASVALDLQRVEDAQLLTEKQLGDAKAILDKIEESMTDNLKTMAENVDVVQSRLRELSAASPK